VPLTGALIAALGLALVVLHMTRERSGPASGQVAEA
jgi:hypothetical protein